MTTEIRSYVALGDSFTEASTISPRRTVATVAGPTGSRNASMPGSRACATRTWPSGAKRSARSPTARSGRHLAAA